MSKNGQKRAPRVSTTTRRGTAAVKAGPADGHSAGHHSTKPRPTEPRSDEQHPDALDPVLKPRSVAIVGATPRKGSLGRELLRNIVEADFNGVVYPVHPKAPYVHSMKAYKSVLDIPDEVDLAIIVVPRDHVPKVIDECGRKGIKGLCVISAGFREIGGDGIRREHELMTLLEKYGMRMVGPNCMGLINMHPDVRLNATFAPANPGSGPLAFLSQSGALGQSILQNMESLDIGISHFVSIGNSADIKSNDLLAYWENDPSTEVIALYMESLPDPQTLSRLARRISKKKPMVVVKSGRTAAGARAASSHTGALSATDVITNALFRQCGIIRANTTEEMLALLVGFCRAPLPTGKHVAILTNSGGPGIMATDALVSSGLEMARFSEETARTLHNTLPTQASSANPIDLTAWGTEEAYRKILPILFDDPGVDIILALFVPPLMVAPAAVARAIAESRQGRAKPILGVIMAEESSYRTLPREIPDCPPIFPFPEMAVKVCVEMYNYAQWQKRPEGEIRRFEVDRDKARAILRDYVGKRSGYLPTVDCMRILECYGFPTAPVIETEGAEEALAAAHKLGYPLTFKAAGRKFVHKSDWGGVVLDITNDLELQGAHAQIKRAIEKMGHSPDEEAGLVQRMAKPGREVILGMNSTPRMGPSIMFGMGGKYVEVMKDVTIRIPPITDIDADEMLHSIMAYPLLKGVRGEEPVALDLLKECLMRLSQMVLDLDEIIELDLNPFIMNPDPSDCTVVDARIRVRGSDAAEKR
jgi:acetyltransferase